MIRIHISPTQLSLCPSIIAHLRRTCRPVYLFISHLSTISPPRRRKYIDSVEYHPKMNASDKFSCKRIQRHFTEVLPLTLSPYLLTFMEPRNRFRGVDSARLGESIPGILKRSTNKGFVIKCATLGSAVHGRSVAGSVESSTRALCV